VPLARRRSAALVGTDIVARLIRTVMCQYCSYRFHDEWGALLAYDEVYQAAMGATSQSTYGFHEEWDELREEVGYGA